jgi:2-oxoglutarate dehydrogenase E1 component
VLLCSGKIYYELVKKREELERWDVAIIRLEQLYPLQWNRLDRELEQYGKGVPVLWVQEEPENMGAWRYLQALVGDKLFDRHPFTGIYREASASPATGSAQSHKIEQDAVVSLAFAGL